MTNETVREFIEKLKKLDQDAIMCSLDPDGDEISYSTLEMVRQFDDVDYIDDCGDTKHGNIVAVY